MPHADDATRRHRTTARAARCRAGRRDRRRGARRARSTRRLRAPSAPARARTSRRLQASARRPSASGRRARARHARLRATTRWSAWSTGCAQTPEDIVARRATTLSVRAAAGAHRDEVRARRRRHRAARAHLSRRHQRRAAADGAHRRRTRARRGVTGARVPCASSAPRRRGLAQRLRRRVDACCDAPRGAYRAGFVVRATAPANPDAAPADCVFDEPAVAGRRRPSRAPMLLPDRFVVLAYAVDPATAALREVVARGRCAHSRRSRASDPRRRPRSWLSRDDATGRLDRARRAAMDGRLRRRRARRHGAADTARRAARHTSDSTASIAIGVRSATPAGAGTGGAAGAAREASRTATAARSSAPARRPTIPTSLPSGWQPPPTDAEQLFAHRGRAARHRAQDGRARHHRRLRACASCSGCDRSSCAVCPNAAATDIAEALAMNRAAGAGNARRLRRRVPAVPSSSAETATALHRFFVTWTSGRGLYPALRIGRQPYGIVRDERVAELRRSRPVPCPSRSRRRRAGSPRADRAHRPIGRCSRGARRTPDRAAPIRSALLLDIIGLAGELDHVRVAQGRIRRLRAAAACVSAAPPRPRAMVRRARRHARPELDGRSISRRETTPDRSAARAPSSSCATRSRGARRWSTAIPRCRCRRRDPIAPVRRHAQLSVVAREGLARRPASQRFVGADGTTVPPPRRCSTCCCVTRYWPRSSAGTLDSGKAARRAAFSTCVDRDPLIANIGDEQHVLRRDYLDVDASRLGLARSATAAGGLGAGDGTSA